jgi:hypothetical protein
MKTEIKVVLITFTHDYEVVGTKGTTRWFKLKDQVYAGALEHVLLNKDEVVPCYSIADLETEEVWYIPKYVAVEGEDIIPENKKSVDAWYKKMFFHDFTGDIAGVAYALEGIRLHGRLEHNGEQLYAEINKLEGRENKDSIEIDKNIKF